MATAVTSRQLFDVELEPISGSRFQPTGFPDIGAAVFDRPVRSNGQVVWTPALVLESAQSMANHLEAVGWDKASRKPVETLAGLPYVRVVTRHGEYLTSSRTEAHRLASAFIKDAELDGRNMKDVIRERLDLRDDTPLAPRDIARAVAGLDPLCLLHGVFFAESAKVWPGQPKIARAVTAFVEAVDVRPAVSGGVKRDDVRHSIGDTGGATEGYGFVPFHRTEYTAAQIVASFSIDLAQIRSYGLGEPAEALLGAVARWQIRSLLDAGFRPRTACDLAPVDQDITDRNRQPLPPRDELASEVRQLIPACGDLFGDGTPLTVVWAAQARPEKGSAS